VVVHGGIDLGYHRLGPRQAREQLIIGLLTPPADPGRRFLSDDEVAQIHAFIADVDAQPRDQLGDCLFFLEAKRAAQGVYSAGACCGASSFRHNVKVSLTANRVKVNLTIVGADEFRAPPQSFTAMMAEAERLGGKRQLGPERVPAGLVIGHFTDPEGNLIGVAGMA
jgi:hypothetical protein